MEVEVTSDNFETEVIKSSIPVLVDFWAPWCGPCKTIAPHIEQIAKDFEGKIKICKLNVDEAPDVATHYTVMSIPMLLIFREGKVMDKKVGVINRSELERFIYPHLT